MKVFAVLLVLLCSPILLLAQDSESFELLGALPGAARDAVSFQEYAVWGAGHLLHVCDVSNPAEPVLAHSLLMPGSVRALSVVGEYVFVANAEAGIQVVSLETPTAPQIIGHLGDLGTCIGIDASGDCLLAVSDELGALFIDVTQPASPELVMQTGVATEVSDVAVDGELACYSDDSGIHFYDVAIAERPVYRSSYLADNYYNRCDLNGQRAIFVACDDSLHLLQIDAGFNVIQLSAFEFEEFAPAVQLLEEQILIADNLMLNLFDIRDPSNPSFQFSSSSFGEIEGFHESDGIVLVADAKAGLRTVAHDNTGFVNLGQSDSASLSYSVVARGDTCYTISDPPFLKVHRIAENGSPVTIATHPLENRAKIHQISGDTLVVTMGSELVLYDIGNPQNLTELCRHDYSEYLIKAELRNNILFLLLYNEGLKVLDYSNILSPQLISQANGLHTHVDFEIHESTITVASAGGLFRAAIEEDYTLSFLGSLEIPQLYSVMCYEDYIYTSTLHEALVVDAHDPSQLAVCDTLGHYPSADHGVVVGTTLFLPANGLHAYSLVDPAHPVLMGSYLTNGTTGDAIYEEGRLYLGSFLSGMLILEYELPCSPQEVQIEISLVAGSVRLDWNQSGHNYWDVHRLSYPWQALSESTFYARVRHPAYLVNNALQHQAEYYRVVGCITDLD